jgi:hypothetical protein
VSLASTANSLPPGVYTTTVVFNNLTSGVSQPRQCTLAVSPLELVQNGGFESDSFLNWTLSGDTSFTSVDIGTSFGGAIVYPHSGSYQAILGTSGSQGSISQTLSTSPGQGYLVSLWYNTFDGATPNQFEVNWNGSVLTNLVDQPTFPGDGWLNLQFLVNATGTSTVLQFIFQDDPSYLALDDVSVQPVPAPAFLPLSTTPGAINFSWYGMSNIVYQLQYKTNLAQPGWINLGGAITATNNALSASNSIGPNPQRFYRLSVLP